ncbi:hypothetical protein Glove_103g220 [Diversispora epigaea]|uniref:Uncharacterized protein n=1 Tax=Diversispora epigaea TaxID=1348612 RepID=A0A397J6Y9_9GLOM|nr:hypothetical protein Glove_103g220 [Diversispora epigaea]
MVDLDNIPQELREQIYIIQQWMRDLRLDGDLEISRNGIKYNGQTIDISTVTIGELKLNNNVNNNNNVMMLIMFK